jgi:tetratricopeptide (TPR) repeat protein
MNKNRLVFALTFLLGLIIEAEAQVPFTEKELGSDFIRGMELFSKEKYPAAIKLFDSFIEKGSPNTLEINEAEYFRSLAALNLFNPDAEFRMVTFIRTHPESPRINEAWLALADYFYMNKGYRKAVTYYDQVNRQELSVEELPAYFFRYGYSLYIRGDNPKALLMFSEIKDIDTEYTPPALYYFSHIAYEQKMYVTAMEGFMRLKDDETFGGVVPFYIVQMLYLQKNYDEILKTAPDLLNSAGKDRAVEIYRFIGDAYYNKENYKEALPWLEKFATGTRISGREDKYQLGYCYYKTGDIDKAIKILLEISSGSDRLSQNIWYILGDCYLQKGNKKRAQLGFSEASKLNLDKKIREDALFNYAKITYELSYSPFGEVVAAFQEYIELYPGSDRIEEAYNFLVSAYLQGKNYKAALASLDKIRSKDSRLEEAYQRVAFFRGLEMFKNMELQASIDMFDKSLKYEKYNRPLRSRAVYWRGEANYRLGNYDDAKADYTEFLGIPGSSLLNEYKLIRYNLGYTLFNLKDYQNAIIHLKTFESDVANMKSDVIADARNRIADCYYITTNYPAAISYYDKVIDYGKTDADYAMFQKGFSLGLNDNERGKADVLSTLILRYPSSSYVPNAIFERGRAYLKIEEFQKGEADFYSVINSYKSTPFVPRAMVQMGLLYYNLGQNDKAIAEYKKVIEGYKSTPEARYALTGLKNVYVDINDVDSYFAYLKTLQGYGDVNTAQKDSMVYSSGENLFIAGNYVRATEVFRNYINEFPKGNFLQNAQFYLAGCYSKTGNVDEALKLYVAVANSPNNQFTEQSLIAASSMFYDKEDYKSSLDYFSRLEQAAQNSDNKIIALGGELKSAYQLGDAQGTIVCSNKIITAVNMPEELFREAVFMKAKANYSLNNFKEALTDFRKIATEISSVEGAESKYRVAELLYKDNLISESEGVVNEFINQNSPHQFWMARMFLLLSDICVKQGDILQARATLQGLKDYYTIDNDGILDEVKAKLDSLNPGN